MFSRLSMLPLVGAALFCAACDQQQESQVRRQGPLSVAAQAKMIEAGPLPVAFFEGDLSTGERANEVRDAQNRLEQMEVWTAGGEAMGWVTGVGLDAQGRADVVMVRVDRFDDMDQRVVAIPARKFIYLHQRRLLVAAIDKREVENLPDVVVE